MAYGGGDYIDVSIPAAADLSSNQYRLIVVDTNGRGTISAANNKVLGILQNKPAAQDAPARVRIAGISKMVAGEALAENDYIASNAQGFGTAAASAADEVCAICIAAVGGSADIADVVLRHFRY